MYISGRVDIFDMVDMDLFTVVALNMMVLKLGYTGEFEPMFYNYLRPLTSLDEGLYALACKDDVRFLATLVRSFKLIKVYIEHGVTVLDSYLRAPWFRETLEDITDEPADGEAGFANVFGSGVDSLGLSHDESFGVDDLDLNLNEPINLNRLALKNPLWQRLALKNQLWQAPIVEEGNGQEDESAPTDEQFFYDDEGIDTAYKTEYDVQSSKDADTDDDDDDDDVDEDFLIHEENEIVEPDVMSIYGFDSDPGNDEEINYMKRRLAELRTEIEGVINASGQWKRNLKLYKNDSVRIRVRREGKVPVFTMSQGTGTTGPYSGMEARPSGSSGPTIRSKKGRIHISMSKAFRAKAKDEREIRGDHILQYSMLRDYVVELQYTNPNTTVKIAVERNINPSFPTRVFQRIYVCLGALKLGFRSCRRDLLGLDGAFMKGPFPAQVLVAVRLDSNNEIYPLAYALVEAETKSSWY
nr:transposase, MuDR, MULE transposase domain protein [Tanacetum cinerariifolium]